jgi:hypothetical protein
MILMNRVLFCPRGARGASGDSAARATGRTDVMVWMAGGGHRDYAALSRRVLIRRQRLYPFVGDYAGGNQTLARVCFYRLRTVAFYLATSRSRRGPSLTHHLP